VTRLSRVIAILVAVLAPSATFLHPAPAAVTAEILAARALAHLLFPLDRFVAARIGFDRIDYEDDIRTSIDAALLEADHPGLNDAVWATLEPEFRSKAAADWPVFIERAINIYVRRLTASDIDRLRMLYATDPAPSLDDLSPAQRRRFRQAQAEANALVETWQGEASDDWKMRMSILVMTAIDQHAEANPKD
jgi:hypothetical protein